MICPVELIECEDMMNCEDLGCLRLTPEPPAQLPRYVPRLTPDPPAQDRREANILIECLKSMRTRNWHPTHTQS